jgi:formylmethanofuran dehydrogenase subunit E
MMGKKWALADHYITASDMVFTTECDICGLHDDEEKIVVVDDENLCEDCVEDPVEGGGNEPSIST